MKTFFRGRINGVEKDMTHMRLPNVGMQNMLPNLMKQDAKTYRNRSMVLERVDSV